MKPALAIAICLVAASSMAPALSHADEEADLRAKYVEEAAPAWAAYRAEAMKYSSGRVVIQDYDRLPNRRLESETHCEWKRRDDCLLWVGERRSSIAAENERLVHAINSRYSFTLRRFGAGGEWLASEIERGRGRREAQIERHIDTFSVNPISLSAAWRPFEDLAAREGYKVISIARAAKADEGDESLIRVEFAYEPKEDAEGAATVAASGWVKYDPEHFWVVREFEVEMRSPMPRTTTASAVLTYDFGMAKIPLLRKMELVRREPSKGYDHEEIQSFEWDAALPEETEFTLPAFGIDEPEKVMEPR